MRTEYLNYLVEISKHKSMNLASQKLHISPQALSAAIKGLENELQIKLLDRTTTGVTLTTDGEKLKEIALQFFFDLSELQSNKSQKPKISLKQLELNVPYGFCESYLPLLLESLYKDAHDLEVTTTPHDYLALIRLVDNEEIPFALTYKLFINGQIAYNDIPAHFSFTPLYEAKFVAIVPDNFSITNYKKISLKTFLTHPVIAYTPSNHLMKPLHYYCPDIVPKLLSAPTTSAMMSMLAAGKGVSFGMLDSYSNCYVLNYPTNVHAIPFREKVQVINGYIIKKNVPLSPNTIMQLQYLDRFYNAE